MKISLKTRLLTATLLITGVLTTEANATPALDLSKLGSDSGFTNIKTIGNRTTINQSGNIADIYWKTIDTNNGQSVIFNQPNVNSVALNYITNGSATNFAGHLGANGKVVIINPFGITFASGSQVNVGALTATTAGNFFIDNVGRYVAQNFNQSAVNLDGTITAAPGGYVYVMANNINVGANGNVTANKGVVDLLTGTSFYRPDIDHNEGIEVGDSTDSGGHHVPGSVYKNSSININGKLQSKSGLIVAYARATDVNSGFMNLTGVVDSSSLVGLNNVVSKAGATNLASTGTFNDSGLIKDSGTTGSAIDGNHAVSGRIDIGSLGNVNISGNINNQVTNGNNSVLIHTTKNTNITGEIDAAGSNTSAVEIISSGNTVTGNIQAGNGGVGIRSGGTTSLNGYIDVQGKQQGSLPSTTSKNGGNITIISGGNINGNYNLDAGAPQGKAGAVNINSTAGSVTLNARAAGSNIIINAAKDVQLTGKSGDYITAYDGGYPTGPGTGGHIAITAGNNANISTLLSSGNINSGGSIAVKAANILVNAPLVTSSSAGKGGNIIFTGNVNQGTNAAYQISGSTGNGSVIENGTTQ